MASEKEGGRAERILAQAGLQQLGERAGAMLAGLRLQLTGREGWAPKDAAEVVIAFAAGMGKAMGLQAPPPVASGADREALLEAHRALNRVGVALGNAGRGPDWTGTEALAIGSPKAFAELQDAVLVAHDAVSEALRLRAQAFPQVLASDRKMYGDPAETPKDTERGAGVEL